METRMRLSGHLRRHRSQRPCCTLPCIRPAVGHLRLIQAVCIVYSLTKFLDTSLPYISSWPPPLLLMCLPALVQWQHVMDFSFHYLCILFRFPCPTLILLNYHYGTSSSILENNVATYKFIHDVDLNFSNLLSRLPGFRQARLPCCIGLQMHEFYIYRDRERYHGCNAGCPWRHLYRHPDVSGMSVKTSRRSHLRRHENVTMDVMPDVREDICIDIDTFAGMSVKTSQRSHVRRHENVPMDVMPDVRQDICIDIHTFSGMSVTDIPTFTSNGDMRTFPWMSCRMSVKTSV